MRKLLFLAAMMLPVTFFAQNWEIGLMGHAANYQGDVVLPSIFDPKETQPAFGVFLRRNLSPNFGVRLNGVYGTLSGNDANYPELEARGYAFETSIIEGSLLLEYNLLTLEKKDGSLRKVRPYLFGGAGYAVTDPVVNFNEGSENAIQYAALISRDKLDIKKGALVFPLGAGFKFQLNEKVALGIEGGYRVVLSDYIDGISQAGDPDHNDWYLFGGINLSFSLGKAKDSDKDGIADAKDKCPELAGVAENMGCPADRDKDGVYDATDKCPDVAGLTALMGCPDRDGDGVTDASDKCPDAKGLAALMGCPDRDSDGVADGDDKCPDAKGLAALMGCPDRDADGVADGDDKCPDAKGLSALKGCPDRDGDNVADGDDKCPDLKGLAELMGCPSDKDKDGVYDKDDRCPDQPGDKANGGCPVMKAEDKKKLDLAVKNINFETNSAVITKASYKTLDQAVEILSRYDYYSISIEGHTDNVGNDDKNLALSKNRAKACYDYLQGKGIAASRMAHAGFGEARPIADNGTADGKKQNRRVEFVLSVK